MPDEEETTIPGDNNSDESILKEALEQFKESEDGSSHNRITYEDDIKFGRLGDQWPDTVKKSREDDARPCLTINKIPASVRQVLNDARQNRPSIIVHPIDSGADKETAEVINGLVRSIERNSQAGTAYMTALDNTVSGGYGFFTIGIDFADDETFDMECRIHRVANSLAVHWDVNTTRFDAADWNYAFISDVIPKEEFESRYPDAAPVDFEGDDRANFHDGLESGEIRVSEYWQKTEVTRNLFRFNKPLILLDDKQTRIIVIREDNLDEEIQGLMDLQGVQVAKTREVRGHEVTRRIITGVEVLESDPWPGELIPICPVWGEEIVIGGRRYLRSMIADSIDAQRMYNYWRSAETELVSLAPKAPFIGPMGFVPDGQENKWETANTRSYAYLEYEGQVPPQRQPFAGIPSGALQAALNASDDMKATMGIFDASLGAQGNETSGKAILARQRQGDVSQFHFVDNLSRAINYAGRILVEIIPHVYTPRTAIRILGLDDKEKVVNLASGQNQPDKQSGNERLYDLNVGRYDVTVKAGPSYQSQREETRETIIELIRNIPNAAPEAALVMGVKLLETMDFVGSDELAQQIGLLLPPQIQQMNSKEGQADLPPEAQQAIALAQNQIKQLQQQLQQGAQIVQEGQQKIQGLENNAALEQGKLQAESKKMEIEDGKASRNAQIDAMKLEIERMRLEREKIQNIEETEGQNRLAAVEQNVEQIVQVVTQIGQAVAEAGQQDARATTLLAEALLVPKVMIRDEEGKIERIEPVQSELEFSDNG